MTTEHFELSEHDAEFVRNCVIEGRYKDANAVVEAGLRLLGEREEEERLQLEHLRAEVKKGMDDLEAGRYVEVNSPEELQTHFDNLKQEAALRLQKGQARVSGAKYRSHVSTDLRAHARHVPIGVGDRPCSETVDLAARQW